MSTYPALIPPDPYHDWDAAYVLGALSPGDRRDFEGHLAGCPACAARVGELAVLPGLLASVPPEQAVELAAGTQATATPLPESLLPGAVRRARRQQQRRQALLASVAALLLLLAGVGVGDLLARRGVLPISPSAVTTPYRLAFTPVTPTRVMALADVVPVGGGTEFRLECYYPTSGSSHPRPYTYGVWIIDRSGQRSRAATWTGSANEVMRPVARSALPPDEIAGVEIRTVPSNLLLLQAELR